MKNLLKETIDTLNKYGKVEEDVLWCGGSTKFTRTPWFENDKFVKMSWKDFEQIANKEYDNGYGREEVNTFLIIAGKDFWLERASYDGAEGWQFKAFPDPEDYEDGVIGGFFGRRLTHFLRRSN